MCTRVCASVRGCGGLCVSEMLYVLQSVYLSVL